MRFMLAGLLISCTAVAADLPPAAPDTVALLRAHAQPLTGAASDYDPLLEAVGAARMVMLGESTHGSREFYRERARITSRLIEEKGFDAVVFEAPWEPLRRLDAYVRGAGADGDAAAALGDVLRFPRWTWRNTEMREFAEWLRRHNRQAGRAVRLYGMDLYSLPESARAVAAHVAAVAPEEGAAARRDYRCFDDYTGEPQDYGHAVAVLGRPGCGAGARRQLALRQVAVLLAGVPDEALFDAWQSAATVAAGEQYYRAMYRQDVSSWNLRERHMADTLGRLRDQLTAVLGRPAKLVVWAHNMHQGDARATDQSAVGEVSLGQLMRERYGAEAFLVGFSTSSGTVRAASDWGGRDRVMRLRAALPGSWSAAYSRVGQPAFLLTLSDRPALVAALAEPRLERVVGVAYLPREERTSHYLAVRPSAQFDALIHWDVTSAIEPLAATATVLPAARRSRSAGD